MRHCSGCQGLANGLLPCVTASTRLLYLYYSYYSTSLACTTAPPHVSQARHEHLLDLQHTLAVNLAMPEIVVKW